MAYTKYSLTPANNNAAPPDGAPEGMLPSAVNDTMRDMMAQIRDCGDGIRGGTYTMTAPVITGGSISGSTMSSNVITGGSINNTPIGASTANTGSFTSLTDSGNLTFTGTGNRITGDFSNATLANRVAFQTSTSNSTTAIGLLPNGAGTAANLQIFNNSDPTNASRIYVQSTVDATQIVSDKTGTGTYLPLTMLTGGSERLRIDTSGNVGIGTGNLTFSGAGQRITGDFSNATVANRVSFQSSTTNGNTSVAIVPNGTSVNANLVSYNNSSITNSSRMVIGVGPAEANITSDSIGTGTYLPLTIYTGGSERLRIDTSGNVGIGVTPSAWGSSYKAQQIGQAGVISGHTAVAAMTLTSNAYENSGWKAITTNPAQRIDLSSDNNATIFYRAASATAGSALSWSESMRIDSSGNLLVGTTSVINSGKLSLVGATNIATKGATSSNSGTWSMCRADTGAQVWVVTSNSDNFFIADADFSHYAFLVQNPTSWIFASDARLKTDIKELDYGLDTVMAMQPKRFKFIQSGKEDIGFIAQELREVVPEAVLGTELPFSDEDTPQEQAGKTLGVGKETIIPVLVKAIQEQQAMINELKAKVAALEAA